jgi:Uri superfamily endonuclease
MKGTYLLLMKLKKNTTITIGKQGDIFFKKGCYLYVGSALNGLDQRIQRHLRKQKKMHWHIDYLLLHTTIHHVFYTESTSKQECTIAQVLDNELCSVPGFGSSDCSCISHLFSGTYDDIIHVINSLHMTSYQLHAKS